MHKSENTAANTIVEQMQRTQALARAEWESAQRIFDIQSTGLRRLFELHDGRTKHREQHTQHAALTNLASPWTGLYQQAITNAMEASAISMDTLAGIQAEMVRNSHEVLPLFQRELMDGMAKLSHAMETIPTVSPPSATTSSRPAKNV